MDIDLIFKALANPTRRQILEWLKHPEQFLSSDECGDFRRGVCAGHIERLGNVSQSTMSNHLTDPDAIHDRHAITAPQLSPLGHVQLE